MDCKGWGQGWGLGSPQVTLVSWNPHPVGGYGAHTHLVPDALALTRALGIHPQVGAELVGAHAWVASRPRQQAGPRGQPKHEE